MLKVKNSLYFLITAAVLAASLFLIGREYYETIIFSNFPSAFLKPGPAASKETIKLMFVGDIMLDRGVESSVFGNGEGEFSFLFEKCIEVLKKPDILFGNLESVISDKGVKVGSRHSFRAQPEAINGLTGAGFDIVSVANNHIFDYSRVAMEDSFTCLREAGVKITGGGFSCDEACSPTTIERKGVKVAFLAYTELAAKHWLAGEERSGICFLKEDNLSSGLEKAAIADIVVVSIHFGDEYQKEPTSQQKYWARSAIDKGADLVIGHHPHVVQPVEHYNNGFIAYSLGNFIFDQSFSEETIKGLLVEVEANRQGVERIKLYRTRLNDYFQPQIVEVTG